MSNIRNIFPIHLKKFKQKSGLCPDFFYAIKTQKHVKKIINELLFFFFYYDISINSNNILLWSKYVYENIVKDLEYRSFGIKFIEYLENGDSLKIK